MCPARRGARCSAPAPWHSRGALVLFNSGGRGSDTSQPAPALTVVPSGVRVRLFAIDGFDPALYDTLAAAGRLPALSTAFAGAARGSRSTMRSASGAAGRSIRRGCGRPSRPAQPASVHGVRTLETRRVAGVQGILQAGDASTVGRLLGASTDLLRLTRPSVASGTERREKTFWEVAADAGLRTASSTGGRRGRRPRPTASILSDRATLRLERGGALDAEIAPAPSTSGSQPRWPALRAARHGAGSAGAGPPAGRRRCRGNPAAIGGARRDDAAAGR